MQPIKDIETVYSWLDSHGVADVLLEKDLKTATMEILPEGSTLDCVPFKTHAGVGVVLL